MARCSQCNASSYRRLDPEEVEKEFFVDNLLVQIHFIVGMIRWTGLARWEFEFPFPSSSSSLLSL